MFDLFDRLDSSSENDAFGRYIVADQTAHAIRRNVAIARQALGETVDSEGDAEPDYVLFGATLDAVFSWQKPADFLPKYMLDGAGCFLLTCPRFPEMKGKVQLYAWVLVPVATTFDTQLQPFVIQRERPGRLDYSNQLVRSALIGALCYALLRGEAKRFDDFIGIVTWLSAPVGTLMYGPWGGDIAKGAWGRITSDVRNALQPARG
jgi:hypothetical protein